MKIWSNPAEVTAHGTCIKQNTFVTSLGTYLVRIFKYKGYLVFHKCRNGRVVECSLLAKIEEKETKENA